MKCLLCDKINDDFFELQELFSLKPLRESSICQDCENQFLPISPICCCGQCGRSLQKPERYCGDCIRRNKIENFVVVNRSLYKYNSAMKNFMKRYKFLGDFRLRKVFLKKFQTYIKNKIDHEIIVPIPVSNETYKSRGFNQVTGLIQDLNYQNVLRIKHDFKKSQSEKNRNQRIQTSQPFIIEDQFQQAINGKKVLLIDDVYTTGTTIYHAARVLKAAGVLKVASITLAR